MSDSTKSLDRWRFELKSIGRKHWLTFYKELLGSNASSIPRLYKTINLYGEEIVFDAIVSSSDKELTGDPLNYVVAVAKSLWKEEQAKKDQEDEYDKNIRAAKEESEKANEALRQKLEKLK